MSTRSDIIVKRTDGTYARIYCHFDGYPSHNGRILLDHYNSQKRAESLVKLGDLSILAPKNTKPKGHSFDTKVDGYCVYYGRDRGEKDVAAVIGATLADVWPDADTWTEYAYLWDGAEWLVCPVPGPSSTLRQVPAVLMDEAVTAS